MDIKKYRIKRIDGPSIIGSGSKTGEKALFLGFGGCNRWSGHPEFKTKSICSFCDTDFYKAPLMDVEEIVIELLRKNHNHNPPLPVFFTGGEPTLQLDQRLLVNIGAYFPKRYIETNGSMRLHRLQYWHYIACSPKQPLEETELQRCDDLKILYPFISSKITLERFLDFPAKNIYIQPIVEGGLYSKMSELNRDMTKEYVLNARIKGKKIKFSGQFNKFLGVRN